MNTLIHTATLAAAALLPAAVLAQATPTAYAERSELIGTGESVRLYGLSTKDSTGKIRCWDVTMTLAIGSAGKPADSATVASAACPKIKPGDFVAGSYTNAGGTWTCSLVPSSFAGRTQLQLFCTNTIDGRHYTYTWYTGAIAGHPLEAQLRAAKLDTLPGSAEYSWGSMTRTDYSSGCTLFGTLFGARQVAEHLDLSIYGDDVVLDCTSEFLKVTP